MMKGSPLLQQRRRNTKLSWLNPSLRIWFIIHMIFSLVLLVFVAQSAASRFILIVLAAIIEILVHTKNMYILFENKKLLAYIILLIIQYGAVHNISQLTVPREIEIRGLPRPAKEFPGSSSGDPRIVTGPEGVVESPFRQLDDAAVISAAVSSAINNEKPYVTGHDFSIIIPGRDEELYISKTIKFTIENTASKYLKEIIVVDDASRVPLADVLDRELPKSYRKLVKVYRFDEKQGLIRARIYGADHSTGSNIFFLDGHCKPKKGWLEPLLKHLKTNYKRLACPVIQDIRKDTWEDAGTSGAKMMFEWNFEFGWYDDLTDEVPISSGGIIALTRKWWEESGKYDSGMLEWGGENLEQSMRVWMCGGEIFVVRDSFVGHIFDRPPKPNPGNSLVTQVQKNQKRAALVWLDDYYKHFETFHPVVKSLDEGTNLEERFSLRNRLNCRSFQWYVDKFRTSFERNGLLVDEFRYIIHPSSRWCLTAAVPTQAPNAPKHPTVVLDPCKRNNLNQEWQSVAGGRMLYNRATRKCLDRNSSSRFFSGDEVPTLKDCEWNSIFKGEGEQQFWQFDGINSGRIFSYSTTLYKTLTGNDRFLIDSEKAQQSASWCLTSLLHFWNIPKIDSSSTIGPDVATPVDIYMSPCKPAINGTIGIWQDPQKFEW